MNVQRWSPSRVEPIFLPHRIDVEGRLLGEIALYGMLDNLWHGLDGVVVRDHHSPPGRVVKGRAAEKSCARRRTGRMLECARETQPLAVFWQLVMAPIPQELGSTTEFAHLAT